MTTPALWGNPFGVSTTTGTQASMRTATFADGSFVAVWVDESRTGADTSGSAIRGQIFNADGSKRGSEFVVNTAVEGIQAQPDITVLSDGRFVVAWADESGMDDKSGFGIRARIFNMDGTGFNRTGAVGGDADFQVNTTSQVGTQSMPSIAALANGGFVIAFQDIGGSTSQIKAQAFDALGFQSGAEAQVGPEGTGYRTSPIVVASDKGYTVFYHSNVEGTPSLFGRTFFTDGREPSAEFAVSSIDVVDDLPPPAAQLSNGRFVVTWVSGTSTPLISSSKAQIYNADGSKFGGEINIIESDAPIQFVIDVTALSNGGFAVAFVSGTVADGEDKFDVGVAIFDANGNKTSINTKINQIRFELFTTVRISELADGRVVMTSTAFDESDDINVIGQILDGRTTAISLPGTNGNDEYYGTAFNDSLNGAAGNDKLVGEAGDDILNGGTGIDTMIGGLGNDTYHVDHADDQVVEMVGGGVDTVVSSVNYTLGIEVENLAGSGPAALRLTGNALANTITGGADDDTIDGAAGADTMIGGLGNDTFHVDHAGDQVTELTGDGTDTVVSTISYALSAEVEKLIGSGSGALRLIGNALNNAVIGADGKDRLEGGDGNDTLNGGSGNDVLIGGKGKDVFVFASKLGTSKTDRKVNFDTISDFKLQEDKIHLDNAIFTKLKKTGKLSKGFFSIDKANDKNDYIIYNKSKGVLSYDVDGSGGKKAVEFAKVKAKLNLKYSDFFVI